MLTLSFRDRPYLIAYRDCCGQDSCGRCPKAMQTYARNCQGCHGDTGVSAREVPSLAGRVGYFTRSEEGRAYLVQVPNVALSVINDEDLAEMLNWMLTRFGTDQLPTDFKPYTADEVGSLRKTRIAPLARRTEIIKILQDRNLLPNKEVLTSAY